jgi:uncharacterized protein (TIGR02588 family)
VRQNWLEWAVLVVSGAVIAALVGYLAITAVSTPSPPAISILGHLDEARSTDVGWELPVTVRNEGGEAAALVAIEGTATVAGEVETSEVEIDLLGPGTKADLVLVFSEAPDGEVHLRLVGYRLP